MRLLTRFLVVILLAGVGLAGVGATLVPIAGGLGSAGSSSVAAIELGPLDQRSFVYAADGSVMATFRAEIDREPVRLGAVPDHVVAAVLAVEDAEFYQHGGVNLRATLRALVRNVDEGSITQGGSTLTQQLVKQELVGDAQSVERKTREAVLAARLEREMSKDEILERYLNTVYFGRGAYGVQAAAETYFGVDVGDLGVAEAALLAGIIANPSRFDPIREPEASSARRDLALARMVEVGVIDADAADLYAQVPLPDGVNEFFARPDDYFAEEVKRLLLDDPRLGATRDERAQAVFRGGLRIHTTFDRRAQLLAVASRNDVIAEVAPDDSRPGTVPLSPDPMSGEERYGTGAVVSVEPSTGAVRAMVGGPGFDLYQYNIVTQARRQTGSAFKTFVLMALLENGYVPNDTVSGSGPCTFDVGLPEPYRVENFSNSRGGSGTITSQTTRSSNCAFVRLGQIVGLDRVAEQAARMGVTSELNPAFWSMPLGSIEMSPLEMAAAYATIANDGVYNPPYLIERVEDRSGRLLFAHQPASRRAFSPQSARLAAEILEQNVVSGTGTRARIPNQHAAGKTGTAQGSGDAWFVGFTPYLATAVWMGSPHDRFDMRIRGVGVTGGSYPAEIWGRYMRAWHEGLPELGYPEPGPTRGGRFLSLDRRVDPRGSSPPTQQRRRAPARPSSPATTEALAPSDGGSDTDGTVDDGGGGDTGGDGGGDPGGDTGGDDGGGDGGGDPGGDTGGDGGGEPPDP